MAEEDAWNLSISNWTEINIKHGLEAMRKVIQEHVDVTNAMERADLGCIDFVWGVPGSGKKFKKGYGIAHIIAKRNSENGNGEKIACKLVEVIAKGVNVDIQKSQNGYGEARVRIHYDGFTAVLTANNGYRNAWLLTGWEFENNNKRETIVTSEGYDSTSATAVGTTLTRFNGAASLIDTNVSHISSNVKMENDGILVGKS